jgi:hypothetical protein
VSLEGFGQKWTDVGTSVVLRKEHTYGKENLNEMCRLVVVPHSYLQ